MKFYRLLLIIPTMILMMILIACNDLQEPFEGPNGLYGYKDISGKIRVKAKYQAALGFDQGFAKVRLNGQWGFINKRGKEVIPPKYDMVENFDFFGFAKVRLNGQWGVINKRGKEVVPLKYNWIGAGYSLADGFLPVELKGKFGFVDQQGNEVIPLKYDDVKYFSEGLAAVGLGGPQFRGRKWGFIDKTGKEVIPLKYDRVDYFREGFAEVYLGDKWTDDANAGYIDKKGNEYWVKSRDQAREQMETR